MSGLWSKLVEQNIVNAGSYSSFWNGVNVWIDRPHLVNRKLLATEILQLCSIPSVLKNRTADFGEEDYHYFTNHVFLNNNFDSNGSSQENVENRSNVNDENNSVICFRKLVPRNLSKFSEVLELVVKDEEQNIVIFWPKESDVFNSAITPTFPYRIKYDDNKIVIEVHKKPSPSSIKEKMSEEWLKSCVLPKIIKWCSFSPTTSSLPSLSLVSAKSYSIIYNYLKEKYSKKYIETWPECSDPLKYVYEDIAIAAYLMTFWEMERNELGLSTKQSFVDLGCGNGLLVDLLSSEGYPGIGIDVRKRKIWDLYEKNTVLVEKAVEPSDYNIFPNYDWIIGNHSDELTPWIPVIAARSSYRMRVFLMPCCPFTFNGKYGRCSQGKTQYQSYLSFIHTLCECMGFVVHQDKLRIPSTKRICFLCVTRNYDEEDEKNIDVKRKEFIEIHSKKNEPLPSNSKCGMKNRVVREQNASTDDILLKESHWISDFKPRDRVEVVQNCSQLDKKFLENTVSTVVSLLLKTENYVSLEKGSETILWNAGGKIKFIELIKMIDPQILKCMKNQCGGFQTFLRNHRNVFQMSQGYVQLTVPIKGIPLNSEPISKKRKRIVKQYNFKGKPCFFFFHHPQSCPLEDKDCNFSHEIN